MKIQNIKKGFTLIELLVVITIIGILATWATTVYTSQIQKARDSTRITDIEAVKWWVEQFYQDRWEYPVKWVATFSWVTAYVPRLPKDPKSLQASAQSVFDYLYSVSPDSNSVINQEFEISTHFEQSWNITNRAADATDWWNDPVRLEMWINLKNTAHNTTVAITTWIPSTVATMTCVSAAWAATSPCTAATPMIIRWN